MTRRRELYLSRLKLAVPLQLKRGAESGKTSPNSAAGAGARACAG
jgi:hypothetical protein